MNYKFEHVEGQLFLIVEIDGKTYKKNCTEYFEKGSPYDDWLDWRLGL